MKTKLFIALLVLMAYSLNIMAQQPYNPYKSIGKEATVLTLSNGKYDEFFDTDSLVVIGSAVLNTRTMKVVGFVTQDTLYSEATLEPEIVSRWLSPDPIAAKYPNMSPYCFVGNMPIVAIDPNGKEIFITSSNSEAEKQFQTTISLVFDKKVEAIINEGKLTFNVASGYAMEDLSSEQQATFKQLSYYANVREKNIGVTLERTAGLSEKTIEDFGDNFYTNTLYSSDLEKTTNANKTAGLALTYHFFVEQWNGKYPDKRSVNYEESGAEDLSCQNCLYQYAHNYAIKSSLGKLGIKFKDISSPTDPNNANLEYTNKEGKMMFNLKISLDEKKEFNVVSE